MTAQLKPRVEQSNAQSHRWMATIDGFPELDLKLIDFTLPMISIGETDLGGPAYHRVKVPGDRLEFDEIQLNYMVDKRYKNYFKVYHWLLYNVKNPTHQTRDITVHLLDNQGQPQGLSITYTNAWPIMLAPIALDSEGAAGNIQAALSLKFDEIVIADSQEESSTE